MWRPGDCNNVIISEQSYSQTARETCDSLSHLASQVHPALSHNCVFTAALSGPQWPSVALSGPQPSLVTSTELSHVQPGQARPGLEVHKIKETGWLAWLLGQGRLSQ